MRVLDFGSSAGYAAPSQQNSNQSTNTNPIFARESKHNKHGNLNTPHSELLYENEYNTTFQNSADEFVKKALNSSLSSTYKSNEHQLSNCILNDKNDRIVKAIHKGYNSELDNCKKSEFYNRNSDRTISFNDSLENTRIGEYIKDLKNINNTQSIELNATSFVINDCTFRKTNETFSHESESNSPDMKTIATVEKEIEDDFTIYNSNYEQNSKNSRNQTPPILHNGFEDQPMVDICTDNIKISSEESLTSPSTSSISLDTSKISYFPRGIINPNYPGFQHFAHTLSEHFIGNSSSDTYDSDMSEYEMELSADSLEDLSLEQAQLDTNLNNHNNINKNTINLDNNVSTQSENSYSKYTNYTNITFDANCNTSIRKGHDQMFIETDNDITPIELVSSVEYNSINNELKTFKPKEYIKANQSSTTVESQNCSSTPDILIKNSGQKFQLSSKKENRPDLLYGVSPQRVGNKNNIFKKCGFEYHLNESMEIISMSQLKIGHTESNNYLNDNNIKDELNLGMTPVDIIGDFGQEVEREFGLLVSGYRRMVDSNTELHHNDDQPILLNQTEKARLLFIDIKESHSSDNINLQVTDAALSNAKEDINSEKYVEALNQVNDFDKHDTRNTDYVDKEDNNAVDWTGKFMNSCTNNNVKQSSENENNDLQKPKYQKSSYDDRQLPPVAIDYKRCQQSMRAFRKYPNAEKNSKGSNLKLARISKTTFSNRFLNTRSNGNHGKGEKPDTNACRLREKEEKELHQYQQLMSDKESILSNSKYTKLSSWAKYLKNSAKDHGSKITTELISPSALELFDAYKIGETDMETLQKHLKLAKEIEKRRRHDREEIRRRLAMGSEEHHTETKKHSFINSNENFCRISEMSSDNESHSSDSETCPKLSKTKIRNKEVVNTHLKTDGSSSVNCIDQNRQSQQTQAKQLLLSSANEDKECDFFTKQAKLQIEARMALSQAREMAHMQMEIERQNQDVSPITEIIRGCLMKIGVQMVADKRRVSRQMLTDMNIAQLQILVNTLHTHIEQLNETLVNFLMDRDDLHMGQDTMLADIEELTRYIGTKEKMAKQQSKKLHFGKRPK